MRFKPGDVCSFVDEDGLYGVLKILEIIGGLGNDFIYNIAVYQELFEEAPNADDIEELHPFIGHFPISEKYFLSSEPRHILCKRVTGRELGGFKEWFKLWKKGKAGIFEEPITQCIKFISQSLLKKTTFLH